MTTEPTNQITCECNEDDGPCEEHCETLVVRDGASARTADSLLLLVCHDLIELGAEVSPYGADVLARADAAEERCSRYGVSWFCAETDSTTGGDLFGELQSLADQLEVDADVSVYWNDGYVIVRITGGPLLGE